MELDIIQRLKGIFRSTADKHSSEFVKSFESDFIDLDSSLLRITSRDHRPVTHAIYNDECKYVSKHGLFELFKCYNDVRARDGLTVTNITMDVLLDCWRVCMSAGLLPNIIEETTNWFKVEYLSPENFNEITTTHLIQVSKNKDKLNEYYDIIKDLPVCINDFNLCNFVLNNQTNELFLIDVCDVDYTDQFRPEIFFTDRMEEQYTYYICKAMQRLNKSEYAKLIETYLGGVEEIEGIHYF